jgi:type II secretory pathway component GspD/PulD (secretin)
LLVYPHSALPDPRESTVLLKRGVKMIFKPIRFPFAAAMLTLVLTVGALAAETPDDQIVTVVSIASARHARAIVWRLTQEKNPAITIDLIDDNLVLKGRREDVPKGAQFVTNNLAELAKLTDPSLQADIYPLRFLKAETAMKLLQATIPSLNIYSIARPENPAFPTTPKEKRDTATTVISPDASLLSREQIETAASVAQALAELQAQAAVGRGARTAQAAGNGGTADVIPRVSVGSVTPRNGFAGKGIASLLLVGTEAELAQAAGYLEKVDVAPPQVLIEARLIELSPETARSLGIQWSNELDVLATTRVKENSVTNGTGATDVLRFGRFTRSGLQFDATLRALERSGEARTLASPSLTVINEKEAEIFIGDQIKYASSQNTDQQGRIQGNLANSDVGITLRFTPFILPADNSVTMALNPTVSTLIGFTRNLDGREVIPQLRTRRADTTVRMGSGSMLAIGGLISDEEIRRRDRVPILGSLPLVGELFRSRSRSRRRLEVVILIRPWIVDPNKATPPFGYHVGIETLMPSNPPALPELQKRHRLPRSR